MFSQNKKPVKHECTLLCSKDPFRSLVPNNHTVGGGEESYTVWIMQEYGMIESWTKLFNIEIHGQEQVISRVLAIVLYTSSEMGKLFSYMEILTSEDR